MIGLNKNFGFICDGFVIVVCFIYCFVGEGLCFFGVEEWIWGIVFDVRVF